MNLIRENKVYIHDRGYIFFIRSNLYPMYSELPYEWEINLIDFKKEKSVLRRGLSRAGDVMYDCLEFVYSYTFELTDLYK